MSAPSGLNGNARLQGRAAACEGEERSGGGVAIREGFGGKGSPLEAGACGGSPDGLDAGGGGFKAHAEARRERRAAR